MSMDEQEKELIAQIKAMERAEREPVKQPEKTDTQKSIESSAKAICGTIIAMGILAYAISSYAFWKPQNAKETWCLDNGYNLFTKGGDKCNSDYFYYVLGNDLRRHGIR